MVLKLRVRSSGLTMPPGGSLGFLSSGGYHEESHSAEPGRYMHMDVCTYVLSLRHVHMYIFTHVLNTYLYLNFRTSYNYLHSGSCWRTSSSNNFGEWRAGDFLRLNQSNRSLAGRSGSETRPSHLATSTAATLLLGAAACIQVGQMRRPPYEPWSKFRMRALYGDHMASL